MRVLREEKSDGNRLTESGILQKMFEETIDDGVRLRGGVVGGAVGHRDAIIVAEHSVDGERMGNGWPAGGCVLGAAGDEEWSRSHQGVQLVQVVMLGDEFGIAEDFTSGQMAVLMGAARAADTMIICGADFETGRPCCVAGPTRLALGRSPAELLADPQGAMA